MMILKMKECPICKTQFIQYSTLEKCCKNIDCQYEMCMRTLKKNEVKRKRGINKKCLEFRNNDKSHLLKVAQKTFNEYIRIRDKNEPCISCGYQGNNRQWHAGHYRPRGKNSALRFNEFNCHKQCSICNNHLSGNLVLYRENLIKKIGLKSVEELESNRAIKSWSVEEVKEIIAKYKEKLKGQQ